MSYELMEKGVKHRLSPWLKKAIGLTATAAVLIVPSSTIHDRPESLGTAPSAPDFSEYEPDIEIEEAEPTPVVINQPPPPPLMINDVTRDTGTDMQSCEVHRVCGADLGAIVELNDGRYLHLFGDSFQSAGPHLPDLPDGYDKYRPQTALVTDEIPTHGKPIEFDSALGTDSEGIAPDLFGWGHTITDGVAIPGTDDIAISYQNIKGGRPYWKTDQAGIAWSDDGGKTFELTGPIWENNEDNTDPYQMWSMQQDGNHVYVVSVRAGRQPGPMMLFRVPHNKILEKDAYTYWNGDGWGEQKDAEPIMEGHFGEPSLRKISDGNWVLAYADYSGLPKIVTQTLKNPDDGPSGEWLDPVTQLTWHQLEFPYGGYVHPASTADNVIMSVSSWKREWEHDAPEGDKGELIWYFVGHIMRDLGIKPPEDPGQVANLSIP